MKKVARITKQDILGIKPGKFEVFLLESARAVRSAVTYAYQLAQYEDLPKGVLKYSTSADYKNHTAIITAVPVELKYGGNYKTRKNRYNDISRNCRDYRKAS